MKKSLLLILASLLAVFALTGCSDDDDDTPTSPSKVSLPTDPEELAKLAGQYEITFFYTSGANVLPLSSDCSKVAYYTGSANDKCSDVEMKGYANVDFDSKTSTINITSKMQMTNQYLKDPSSANANDKTYWEMAQPNQYNYTVYTPIPLNAINYDTNAINDGDNAVKGTSGRNLKENTIDSKATYKFELLSDGSVRNTMVDYSKGDALKAELTIIMKKIDVLPNDYTMDENVKFPLPEIDGFVSEISTTESGSN